ncbi:transcription factor WRKY45-2-like isoform X2 [Nymphaea colorata]|uniref:transcription factor WRKY45-2-like isoform X2 n=1 Tax=Nymphaea colorata TaxID=210225 RepID=UPI00129E28E8|nr:transcription factor WRKY45-2-like isoform X2 [Nymphaea colorata]
MTMMSREDEEFREQRKLIRELSEGHRYARQLLSLMAAPSDDDGRHEMQRVLIEAVVHSFESAIGILKPDEGGRRTAGEPVLAVQLSESPARENAEAQVRGSCKKRSYFRCTHKFDQGCPAIKQVQRLDHNPSLLQITYMSSHTCKPTRCSPDLAAAAAAADPADRQEFFLNFETNSMPSSCFPPHSSFPIFKQEDNEDLPNEPAHGHRPAAHYSSLHLGADGPFDLLKQLRLGSYGGEVGAGDFSFPGFDMGLARLVEFDDID